MADRVDPREPLVAQLPQISGDHLDLEPVEHAPPEEQPVEDHGPVPGLDQMAAEDHADIPGPAGDEHAHDRCCVSASVAACPSKRYG